MPVNRRLFYEMGSVHTVEYYTAVNRRQPGTYGSTVW